ncbi:MAG: prolipoprotein diacylglyceryl transferase [Termitinemataceae bacterium]|nr:MAG: prolipoprotein diacylglyceryl transferase [Termitinemataceae bacterium]
MRGKTPFCLRFSPLSCDKISPLSCVPLVFRGDLWVIVADAFFLYDGSMLLSINFPSWLHPEIIQGIPFRWYGLMYIVAFGIAYKLCKVQIKERNFPMTEDQLTNMFFWAILGLVLGARLFSELVYESDIRLRAMYRRNPFLIFWPFRDGKFTGLQGMSYHGGAIGCLIGFTAWSIKNKIDVREVGDLLAASIPLGYTFGRLGNFINGELYGRVTTASWGMFFPDAQPLSTVHPWVNEIAAATGAIITKTARGADSGFVNLPRHPSQLYEAFFEGIVIWAVIWLLRNKKPFKGFTFALYAGAYGFVRFFIEYFREPDTSLGYRLQHTFGTWSWNVKVPADQLAYSHPLTSFSTGQFYCAAMVVISIIALIVFSKLPNAKPQIYYQSKEEQNANVKNKNDISTRNKQKRLRKKF